MSDETLRSLLRDAEAKDEGPRWVDAARALARSGLRDQAAYALVRARARAASPSSTEELSDLLAPPSLDGWNVRELLVGGAPLTDALFDASGEFLLAVEEQRTLVEVSVATGAVRKIATFRQSVQAVGAGLDGRRIAVAFRGVVTTIDRATGRPGAPIGRGHERVRALALAPGVLSVADGIFEMGYVVAYPLPADAATATITEEVHLRGSAIDLDRSGAVVAIGLEQSVPGSEGEGERVLALIDARASQPRATYDLAADKERVLRFASFALAAGTRALLVPDEQFSGRRGPELVLFDHDARELIATPAPAWVHAAELAVAPSGRFLAGTHPPFIPGTQTVSDFTEARTDFTLLDLARGTAWTAAHGPGLGSPTWAPSGRRVACATEAGHLLLLEHESS